MRSFTFDTDTENLQKVTYYNNKVSNQTSFYIVESQRRIDDESFELVLVCFNTLNYYTDGDLRRYKLIFQSNFISFNLFKEIPCLNQRDENKTEYEWVKVNYKFVVVADEN